MAKWCPLVNRKVIYQFCEDCDDKICQGKKKTELFVMSEAEAMRYAETVSVPCGIISITTLSEGEIPFADNENIKEIFHMHFNDLEENIQTEALFFKAPVQEDMNGLRDVVDRLFDLDVNEIVVHCAAGISRSAAVAQAISDYKNLGYQFFNDGMHIPNSRVYRLCLNEFGIGKDQAYFEKIFDDK